MAIWICFFWGEFETGGGDLHGNKKKQADNWASGIAGIAGVQFLMPFFAKKNAPKWKGSKIIFLMSKDMIPEPSQNKVP